MEPKFAEDPGASLMDVDVGDSAESFGRFLEAQRELFRSQVDHLQRIVVEQCKLTGANPLSQEMVLLFFFSPFLDVVVQCFFVLRCNPD